MLDWKYTEADLNWLPAGSCTSSDSGKDGGTAQWTAAVRIQEELGAGSACAAMVARPEKGVGWGI